MNFPWMRKIQDNEVGARTDPQTNKENKRTVHACHHSCVRTSKKHRAQRWRRSDRLTDKVKGGKARDRTGNRHRPGKAVHTHTTGPT